jgi:hypothetical protein
VASSPLRSLHRPVTLDARYTVSCDRCQFTADSAAVSADAAAFEFAKRHVHHDTPEVPPLKTEVRDYKAHPLFVGRFEHADAKRERGATIR